VEALGRQCGSNLGKDLDHILIPVYRKIGDDQIRLEADDLLEIEFRIVNSLDLFRRIRVTVT